MYSKQKQPTSGDFNIDDIDALLNSNLDDGEQDVDMNDPDLLKQLQELSSPSTSNKPKATIQPKSQQNDSSKDMHIDIDSYVALAQGNNSEDIHVEFNDNDMNDPNLLSELSSLSNKTSPQLQDDSEQLSGLVNMGFSVYQAKTALEMFDNDIERAANYLLENGSSVIETESSDPMNTLVEHKRQKTSSESQENHEEEDPQEWQKKAKEYQHLALEAKRQGDKKKAVALLRESKSYQQKYDEFASVLNISQEQSKNEPVLTKVPTSTAQPPASPASTFSPPSSEDVTSSTAAQNSLASSPVASPLPRSSSSMSPSQTQEILSEVIKLQKQYKEAAMHYKKLGNLSVAKIMVRTSKDLLHTGIGLKNDTITTPPVLPSAPDMNLGDGKIRQVQEFELSAYDTSYEQMEAQLTYQINICHNLSVQQQNSAHQGKSKKTSTDLADSHQINAYSKLERAFSADLMVLQTNKSNISSLHFEQVSYVYRNIIDSVPDNMMQFKVIRALNLPTLDISTKLDCFVTWDFGGWPPENTAQAAMNKGETPIVSGTDPQFDFEMQIPISRTNRSFMRYLQRKKLTIEVFHNKYSYGLFRRPISLGKMVISMDKLLTKSSISGIFNLVDGGRKNTGGKIEIQVNLREPLTGEDSVKRSERWLVLDLPGSNASKFMSEAGLTIGGPYIPPSSERNSSSSNEAKQVEDKTEISSETPQPKAEPESDFQANPSSSKPKEADADNNELEAAEEEFNNVDNIVSNMVLEHEVKLVNAGLASKASSAKAKEDLMDRKQALEIKMNMLVIQVQTGLLDMETYLANVQKRMEADRRLAILFKKHNRLDLAKAALARKKIMQDEVDEAKAAMAEEE